MSKVIVVTGTATGLGKATVDKFAAEGWDVVATVRKQADLHLHDANPRVRALLLDVDDEQAAAGFAQQALKHFGRVDALVNNAGYYQMGPVEATSMEQAHRQFPDQRLRADRDHQGVPAILPAAAVRRDRQHLVAHR
jgi:NAD(P)-dependent dehydrogenase (short-subunit alcohol dehydrogenase family)